MIHAVPLIVCLFVARTLSYWCFSAGHSMSQVAGQVKSIILTSGTLKPLDSFVAELKVYDVSIGCTHTVMMYGLQTLLGDSP